MTKLETIIDRMVTQILTIDAGATYTNTVQTANGQRRLNPLQEAGSEFPLVKVYAEALDEPEVLDVSTERWTATIVWEGWLEQECTDTDDHQRINSLLEDCVHLIKTDRKWNSSATNTELGQPEFDSDGAATAFRLPLRVTWTETKKA